MYSKHVDVGYTKLLKGVLILAVFNPIVITTAGISLLSQAMAGKGTLTFTSVATSTTVIPYNISNIQAMTALSGIVQTVVPVSAVLKTGNVQVSSIFSNSSITNAYTANTIGLYAALGNGAQTLLPWQSPLHRITSLYKMIYPHLIFIISLILRYRTHHSSQSRCPKMEAFQPPYLIKCSQA